jgi:hypothetical protein
MLVHQQQAFEFNNSMFLPLSPQQRSHPPTTSSNLDINLELGNNIQGYRTATTSKTKTMQENVEQIVFALSISINSQLANISAILTAQIVDLAAEIDGHQQKTICRTSNSRRNHSSNPRISKDYRRPRSTKINQ